MNLLIILAKIFVVRYAISACPLGLAQLADIVASTSSCRVIKAYLKGKTEGMIVSTDL
jgi:hypothetical protein